jgi:aminoglycoside 2''-phosphotransferase
VKKNNTTSGYLQVIREAYPTFIIHSFSLNEQGQFNDILILNDEFIFRFPRYPPGIQALQVEAAILRSVKSQVSLPVPDPEFLHIDPQAPAKSFMGYRMLPGKPFWRDLQESVVDEPAVCHISFQLGKFLAELHHIPPELIAVELSLQDTLSEWQQMMNEIRSLLFPFMRSEARLQVSHLFEEFIADSTLHFFTPCLRHGDFCTGNFLFDPHTRSICGIIDFGSAGLGDPAADIAAASCMGERYFSSILVAYPQPEVVLRRAQFYRGTFALQEALHGFKNNDQSAFESGIAAYR